MKKILSAAVAFAAAVGMLSLGAIAANAEVTGRGTESDPYIVSTADDWEQVKKSGYIRLDGNIETDTAPKTAGELTIDLNGHTITTTGASVIEVMHSFTLTDNSSEHNGAITNNNTGKSSYGVKCAVKNVEDITIKNVTVNAAAQAIMINAQGTSVNVEDAVINGGQYAFNIVSGNLNIKGNTKVNLDSEYKGSSLTASGGVVVIGDGEFNYNGTTNTVDVSGTADVTISGGTFENANKAKGVISINKNFDGILKINGGTFNAVAEAGNYTILDPSEKSNPENTPKVEISDGTFNGSFGKIKSYAEFVTEITITGGTFAFDPSAYVDTEVYDVTANNSMWTVTEKSAEPEPSTVELTEVGSTVKVGENYGKAFTFEADLNRKQISDIVLTYDNETAKLISDNAIAAIESNAKIGIIVTAETEEKVNAFNSGNVTISFKGGSSDEI